LQLKQPLSTPNITLHAPDPHQPTAVILVGKSLGIAMHTLLGVLRIFPRHFKNFIFVRVGVVDVESFRGRQELEEMRNEVNEMLNYFVAYCQQYGIAAESYSAFGTDVVDNLLKLGEKIGAKYPNSIFFASKLIFEYDNWLTRFLHNETSSTLQYQLHLQGKELMILPMRI